jgi:rfaE bifunctional protein kinase chain/domain
LILQDYNKGLFTSEVIATILADANARNVPTFVDPKRDHFFDFQGATLFKPNRKEVEDALGVRLADATSRESAVRTVRERLACSNVVMTLGADGMIYRAGDADPITVPTHASQVADVSGAGDTVIAMLAAVYCAEGRIDDAVHLANIAAGIVCGRVGTVPIDRALLLEHFAEHAVRIDSAP